MKKWIQRIIFIILILIVIVMVSVLGYQKLYKDKKQKQEGDVIVKENVKVITSDMDKKKKPINVNDDNLVFFQYMLFQTHLLEELTAFLLHTLQLLF